MRMWEGAKASKEPRAAAAAGPQEDVPSLVDLSVATRSLLRPRYSTPPEHCQPRSRPPEQLVVLPDPGDLCHAQSGSRPRACRRRTSSSAIRLRCRRLTSAACSRQRREHSLDRVRAAHGPSGQTSLVECLRPTTTIRQAGPSSRPRDGRPAGGRRRRPPRRCDEARELLCAAPLLRHAPVGGGATTSAPSRNSSATRTSARR